MYEEEEDYEHFKRDEVNHLNKLNYTFNINQRFINVKDINDSPFKCQTPFLRVLKPIHVTLNKKKTIANKYIILELSDELDFNHQIGDFTFIINKLHEISQEKIKDNSLEWFNTEFDEIGLDIKVKRPIEQQRDCEFIKICIPKNKEIEEQVNLLKKGDYILCNIFFKGLKVSNDYINEEWEMSDFITQEKYEQLKNTNLLYEDIENVDKLTTMLEDNEDIENVDKLTTMLEDNQDIENIDQLTTMLEDNKTLTEINNMKEEDKNEINDIQYEETIIEKPENEIHDFEEIDDIQYEETIIKKNHKEKKNKKEKNIHEKIMENKIKKLKNSTVTSEQQVIKKNKKILFF